MSNEHVSPAFHGILSQMSGEDQDMAEYVGLLSSHDWFYQYSDDHKAFCAGRDAMTQLRSLQAQLDPDWAIWNSKCPAEFLVKGGAA